MMFLFHVEGENFEVPAVKFPGYIWRQTFDKHTISYKHMTMTYCDSETTMTKRIPKPWNKLRVEKEAWSGVCHDGFKFRVNCNHHGKDMRNPPEMVETTLSYNVLLSCETLLQPPQIGAEFLPITGSHWSNPTSVTSDPSSPPAPAFAVSGSATSSKMGCA